MGEEKARYEGFVEGMKFIHSYYQVKHSILMLNKIKEIMGSTKHSSDPDKSRGKLGSLEKCLRHTLRKIRKFNVYFREMREKYFKFFAQKDTNDLDTFKEELNEELARTYRELKPYIKKVKAENSAMEE